MALFWRPLLTKTTTRKDIRELKDAAFIIVVFVVDELESLAVYLFRRTTLLG
jgi:hypothetical protein